MCMEPSDGLVISEEVLAEIAAAAARGVSGVSALARQQGERRRSPGKALRYVKISGEAELVVELWLRLKAGTKIIAVASEVQRGVREALQTMAGKTVLRVNLRITGIEAAVQPAAP